MSDTHTTAVAVIERGEDARIHPLVRMMRESGAVIDPAALGEMMKLQREWEAGEAKRAYTAAIVALKRDMPTVIARDKRVKFGAGAGEVNYTHTSLAAVMSAVTGILSAHGFSIGWEPSTGPSGVTVTCRLTHAEGHSETCTISAAADTKGSKSQAQGVASTITLLSRYTALSLLGIATADMTEPRGETDPASVSASENLRMVTAIQRAGKSVPEAETLAGRRVSEWTAGDLDRLRAWLTPSCGDVPEAEVAEPEPAPEPKSATRKGSIDDRLEAAAQELGYKPSAIAARVANHSGDKAAVLAELKAEYLAKHPRQ